MIAPLCRIMGLWSRQTGWLLAGLLIALAALTAGVGLMTMSGLTIGAAVLAGSLAAPALLRAFGTARVVLRYIERLVTHNATFRALADLRVWLFRRLAHSSAGGLGFRHSGDMLARLVGDVEALDGLYLRILLPLAGAVLLLPVLVLLIGHRSPVLAIEVGMLFAAAAFLLPWMAAQDLPGGNRPGDRSKRPARRRPGCPDRPSGSSRLRSRRPYAGSRSSERIGPAVRPADLGEPDRACRSRLLPMRPNRRARGSDRCRRQPVHRGRRRVPGACRV